MTNTFILTSTSDDERFERSLKYRNKLLRIAGPSRDNGKISLEDEDEFRSIIDQNYGWMPSEEQNGYKIFCLLLFEDLGIGAVAGRLGLPISTVQRDCGYFCRIIGRTMPWDVVFHLSPSIRSALQYSNPHLAEHKTPYMARKKNGIYGVVPETVSETAFKAARKLVDKQVYWLKQRYLINGFDADDLNQIILIALNKTLGKYNPAKNGGHIKAYFTLIARRLIKSHLEANQNNPINKSASIDRYRSLRRLFIESSERPSCERGFELLAKIKHVCEMLPPQQRKILIGRTRGRTAAEVAAELGCPKRKVFKLYEQVRYMIKKLLEDKPNKPIQPYKRRAKKKQAPPEKYERAIPAGLLYEIAPGFSLEFKPQSLYKALLTSLAKRGRLASHGALFETLEGKDLVNEIGVPYETLSYDVVMDDEYLLGLEKLMRYAEAGSKLAQKKVEQPHDKRMHEAFYLLAQSATDANNRNARKLRKANLIFMKAKKDGVQLLFLIQTQNKEALEDALAIY